MIVEDEIIEAMFLRKILGLWGYKVSGPVTSGEEALKEVEVQKPDLVLIDVYIRGEVTGIEVAHKIRSQFEIPIVFMSGYSDEETRQKAHSALPVGYFVKPINYDKLRETIQSAINHNSE